VLDLLDKGGPEGREAIGSVEEAKRFLPCLGADPFRLMVGSNAGPSRRSIIKLINGFISVAFSYASKNFSDLTSGLSSHGGYWACNVTKVGKRKRGI